MTHDHCPACAVARELRLHRDATYPTWGKSRAALNFECPDYRPTPKEDA